MRRKYLVGNWKMNGTVAQMAEIAMIDAHAGSCTNIDVALAPPYTLLTPAAAQVKHIAIGVQDCHAADAGAHTGCLSAPMVKEAGATFSIVGHSERRSGQQETSADIAAKASALHGHAMRAIVCVGEDLETREGGDAVSKVCQQLVDSLPESASPEWLTIAYEPIWAIGTGRTAEATDIGEMHEALRARLMDELGPEAEAFHILYGGSVNGSNATEILGTDHVDGALVGGASLAAEKFIPILEGARQL